MLRVTLGQRDPPPFGLYLKPLKLMTPLCTVGPTFVERGLTITAILPPKDP